VYLLLVLFNPLNDLADIALAKAVVAGQFTKRVEPKLGFAVRRGHVDVGSRLFT
jgi:hypothetical protein